MAPPLLPSGLKVSGLGGADGLGEGLGGGLGEGPRAGLGGDLGGLWPPGLLGLCPPGPLGFCWGDTGWYASDPSASCPSMLKDTTVTLHRRDKGR